MRRRFSCASFDERLNGRVISTRRMPKKPFLTSTSLIGVPSAGCGAGVVEVHERALRLVVDACSGTACAVFLRSATSVEHRLLRSRRCPSRRRSRRCSGWCEPSGRFVSMNVRLHSFGQKWQTVSSSFFVVYSRSIAASMPMNVRRAACACTTRSVSIAAPIAPASPVCGCTNTSRARDALLDVVDLRLDGREVVLRAALEHELACRARRGAGSARRTARRSSAAPARGRRAAPPSRSPPSGSSRGRCRGRRRSRS